MLKKSSTNKISFSRILFYFILVIASVSYALPNFFERAPSIVITAKNEKNNTDEMFEGLSNYKDQLGYSSIYKNKDGGINILFPSISSQMSGYEKISNVIDSKDYYKNLTLISTQPSFLKTLGAKPASLGLDLMGGVHFLMEVDTKETEMKVINKYKNNIEERLKEDGFSVSIIKLDSDELVIDNNDKNIETILTTDFIQYFSVKNIDGHLILKIQDSYRKEMIDFAVKQNIFTLQNRINEIGVAEPIIQREGENRIIVQLPGIQDTEKAKEIIGTTATLEFRAVKEDNIADVNSEIISDLENKNKYVFYKSPIITGDSIIDASSGFDPQNNSPLVSVVLDSDAGNIMFDYTTKNKGKYMGSVLKTTEYQTLNNKKTKIVEEHAINVAKIQGTFSNRFQITGLDDKNEAHKLAILLRSGSLAAPVDIIEERTIGPNMGAENVKKGQISITIGFILVLLLMLFKYKSFGMIANFCVFINLMLLLSILSFVGATLTLPGIAGIILTVGMSVDANVVIFERIKEEYIKKNKVKKAIEAGYSKALSSIIDANITTLIAAIMLFSFGSGSIKGFAVTLSIGILTSLITSVYLSKFMIDLTFASKKELRF